MRIHFECLTNLNDVRINTLEIRLPNGTTLTLDRNETNFDIEGNNLSMTWEGCYLWSINNFCIFNDTCSMSTNEFKELIKGALLNFVLEEDDVPENYYVQIKKIEIEE